MREPTKDEEGYADVVVDVPEVGSFYFQRLNILAGTYFVQIPPLELDSPMVLRRAKRVMCKTLDEMLCYCAIYCNDARAIRFAEWMGFRGMHTKDGMLAMKRES